jgi:hypothetical protein
MKHIIIYALIVTFLSCDKESKVAPTELDNTTYDFSKDNCGYNLLKGTYISRSNQNDTIIIDSNISAYVCGNKPYTGIYVDIFHYCAKNETVTLDRWGWTKIGLPTVNVKYSYKAGVLSFSKMDFENFNGLADTFFASINNKSFTKIK